MSLTYIPFDLSIDRVRVGIEPTTSGFSDQWKSQDFSRTSSKAFEPKLLLSKSLFSREY